MQLVIKYKNQITTTSRLVAEKFGKRHDAVLRSIREIECSEEFRAHNFVDSTYLNAQNRKSPMVILSRDGFTMLVMTFSGREAAKFREQFIDEFNRMEAILRQGTTPILIPVYQNRILSEPTKDCPETHFSIFDASHSILMFIEVHVGSLSKYDLADGSIGIHWKKYREGKPWAKEVGTYIHEYEDNRGRRNCNCYLNSELEHFKYWLKNVYKPVHLINYLVDKYTKERNLIMLDKVKELLPRLLKAS